MKRALLRKNGGPSAETHYATPLKTRDIKNLSGMKVRKASISSSL
jgi:hypothetical protein